MKLVTVDTEELSKADSEAIYLSILVRIGFIETGTISRAIDLKRSNPKYVPRILSSDQMQEVLRLENILEKLL